MKASLKGKGIMRAGHNSHLVYKEVMFDDSWEELKNDCELWASNVRVTRSHNYLCDLAGMCKCHYQYVDPWVFVLEIIAQVDG